MTRKLPVFSKEQIEYLYNLVMKSNDHLAETKILGGGKVFAFDGFKNDIANDLTKYKNVLDEMTYVKNKH